MNRDFDFDVRFILDKRERSFHEVYILPFEPREIAQAGSGEVPREDHSAPFPIGGIKQFEDLIWSKEATTRLNGSWTSRGSWDRCGGKH